VRHNDTDPAAKTGRVTGLPVPCPSRPVFSSQNVDIVRKSYAEMALAERRRAFGHQLAFPGERVAHDGVEVLELRRPVQPFADLLAAATDTTISPGRRSLNLTGNG